MSETTVDGWLIIATCELSISTVVAPARAAMARSASGGIVRSCRATRYQLGMSSHAGGPDGVKSDDTAAGRWVAPMIRAVAFGRSWANRMGTHAGSM